MCVNIKRNEYFFTRDDCEEARGKTLEARGEKQDVVFIPLRLEFLFCRRFLFYKHSASTVLGCFSPSVNPVIYCGIKGQLNDDSKDYIFKGFHTTDNVIRVFIKQILCFSVAVSYSGCKSTGIFSAPNIKFGVANHH